MIRFLIMSLSLFLVSPILAQDSILNVMKDRSLSIVQVKVLNVQGGRFEEIGVEMCSAECQILGIIKGASKKGEKLNLTFDRYMHNKVQELGDEPRIVEKDKQYILFIKDDIKDNKGAHNVTLVDRWTGALLYNRYLFTILKR